ncbi:hypothetical protein [Streptomyces sp. 35M1]|uniref:hypothetical protein n=1 Tax=Streptomyces sp. 35M1 TaxID=3142978 RepID=UPI00399072A8
MSISQEDVLNAVAEMSVLEVVELIKAAEVQNGVSAVAVAEALTAAQPDEPGTTEEVAPGLTVSEGSDLNLIPASEVNPEDVATLTIEYREGQPVLVASGGSHIPAEVRMVNAGAPYSMYTGISLAPLRDARNDDDTPLLLSVDTSATDGTQ